MPKQNTKEMVWVSEGFTKQNRKQMPRFAAFAKHITKEMLSFLRNPQSQIHKNASKNARTWGRFTKQNTK